MGFFNTLFTGYKVMGREIKNGVINNRATIGTAVSVGGTIASTIFATQAGAKSVRKIAEREVQLGRPLTFWEKIKVCWIDHVPSVTTAALACGGAIYSNNQHAKEFQKVASAYIGLKNLYDSSKQQTQDFLGEKKTMELNAHKDQQMVNENQEVKKNIISMPPNPDPGRLFKFVEPTTGEGVYLSRDKLKLILTTMKAELAAIPARKTDQRMPLGISIVRLFELAGEDKIVEKLNRSKFKYFGFNKGSEDTNDDLIECSLSPILVGDDDDQEPAFAIDWANEPSDMRVAYLYKL